MCDINSAYTPLLASLITGLVAFIGVVLTNRSNLKRIKLEYENEARRKRLDLYRERGEELYLGVDKWLQYITMIYLNILRIMYGKLTYKQHLELVLKRKVVYDFTRIELIMDVYFPEIRPFFDSVIEARTEINKIESDFHRQCESGNLDGKLYISPFLKAQKKFETAGDQLKSQIKTSLTVI